MTDADFTRRVQMIEAAQGGDFATVNALLKEDTYLRSFTQYLSYLVATDKRDALETSLAFPNLDKNNHYYESMILDLILHAAARGKTETLKFLLPLSPDPKDSATLALRHIFNFMSPGCLDKPSAAAGKILVENGADITQAAMLQEGQLTAQIKAAADTLKKLRRFKTSISPKKPG